MSSPMVNLATGASSTSASTALQPTVAVPLITSFDSLRTTAWISMLPKSSRNVSKLEAASSWNATWSVFVRLDLIALACR